MDAFSFNNHPTKATESARKRLEERAAAAAHAAKIGNRIRLAVRIAPFVVLAAAVYSYL